MPSAKFISSSQFAAPVLSGTPGALVALLDAVLVTGFGSQVANTVTVASNVATVVNASAHSQTVGGTASVSGATPAGLNGEKRVLSVTTNSYTFAAPGIADGLASGTITTRVAPLGWSKQFLVTNLGVYKPLDVTSTGMVLRVDDATTLSARVRGHEAMTDVNTGVGPFPTVGQQAGSGLFWSKSSTANATARKWFVIGDTRGFYLLTNPSDQEYQGVFFGDLIPLKSNDPYSAIIRGSTAETATNVNVYTQGLEYSDPLFASAPSCYWARNPNALGGSVSCFQEASLGPSSTYYSGGSGATLPYPSVVDNGLILVTPRVFKAGVGIRGTMPGLYFSPQNLVGSFESGNSVVGVGQLSGATLVAVKMGALGATSNTAALLLDITSDWRA